MANYSFARNSLRRNTESVEPSAPPVDEVLRSDHPKYRMDIDGLRAFAVLSVIGYHAFPQWITGGFIGVDMFFVISGFLITTIILKGLTTGTFSFPEFCARRARRLLPSLLVVFLACFVVGLFTLYDHELRELGKHIFAGSVFVSNFVLWNDVGYFDTSSDTKPLLHLWSLAIEEQFYIVWPCLLWVLHRMRAPPIWMMLVLGAGSFWIGLYYLDTDATFAFYMPHARFWELLVGATLAYLSLQAAPLRKVPHLLRLTGSNILAFGGSALLLYGFSVTTTSSPFPGWYATLPVFGTALLIAAGPAALPNRWLLSLKPIVWVGKISYVAYLWHWPILVFQQILLDGQVSLTARALAVVLTIALAALTHYKIENPMRFSKRKTTIRWVIGATLVAALIGSITHAFNGLPFRYANDPNDLSQRFVREGAPFGTSCLDTVSEKSSTFCVQNPNTRVVILGDSHASAMYYGFATSGDPRYDKPTIIGASSCPPSLGMEWRPGCDYTLKIGLKFIADHPAVETVILAAYGGFLKDGEEQQMPKYLEGYNRTIQAIRAMGRKVIVAEDNYELKRSSELCAPSALAIRRYFKQYPSFCDKLEASDLMPRTAYKRLMAQLQSENPDVFFYSPDAWLCPNGQCLLYKDGMLLMSDSDHMSKAGNEFYVRDLIRTFDRSAASHH